MTIRNALFGRGLRICYATAFTVGTGLAIFTGAPAYAEATGTLADTLVSNTATVNYQVGGVDQDPVSDDADFKVDRMVDVQVVNTNGSNLDTVVPAEDETTAILTYTVTNEGNDTQSYDLDLVYTDGANALGLALDTTDDGITLEGEYTLYYDVDGSGDFTAGDIQIDPTGTNNSFTLASGDSVDIIVVAEIPSDASDTDTATIDILATTLDEATTTITTETGTPTIGTTDTVFVDDAGTVTGDIAEDGTHSDAGTFTVQSADLSVSKTVEVIDRDPSVDCATASQDIAAEQFAIPGACIEYTITVTNTGATAAATDVVVADALPAEITWVAFHSTTSAFDTGPTHTVNAGDPLVSGDVAATDLSLAAGGSVQIVIRATIN